MTRHRRKILFWASFGIFIVLALIIPLYSAGYRLDKNFNLTLTGGIFLAVPESGVDVYLNGKLIKTTGIFKSVFLQNLQPKKYSVLAAKEGYWPWTKELEIKESLVSEAKVFMLPKEISGKVLLKGLFTEIKSLPEQNLLVLEEERGNKNITNFYKPETGEFIDLTPQEINELSQKKGNQTTAAKKDAKNQIEIRQESSNSSFKLFAKSLQSFPPYFLENGLENGEILVIESKNKIKNFDFYAGRSDIIIFAMSHGIFAIEIDGRGTRNFQPVYKGVNPDFVILKNKIYVLDEGVLSEIELK